jgi:hypothetical protein
MPLRIGFDMDGVVADMELALVEQAEKLFGPGVKQQRRHTGDEHSMSTLVPEEVSDDAPLRYELELTAKQRRHLWLRVKGIENFWETLAETEPGCVARLAALAEERHWEIIFLTRRPATAGSTSQRQSQQWLEAKGFRLPSVYVVTGSRGLIAAALMLDIVVDDTPENCIDVASDSRARTIAIFRNPETPPPPGLRAMGIHLVRTMDEALALLVEIDSSVEQKPGAMKRVMRTLGLRESGGEPAVPR